MSDDAAKPRLEPEMLAGPTSAGESVEERKCPVCRIIVSHNCVSAIVIQNDFSGCHQTEIIDTNHVTKMWKLTAGKCSLFFNEDTNNEEFVDEAFISFVS
jgi:hypothetical protein